MTTSHMQARSTARGLGWFSIGLGLAELLAPRAMAAAVGMRGSSPLMVRACGLRELACGVGILRSIDRQADPAPWVWARVGGDALDLATLSVGLAGPEPQRAGLALAAVAAVTAADVDCARALSAPTPRAVRDYSDRSGWTRPAAQMRGAAMHYEAPRDMRIPAAMRGLSETPSRIGEVA